MFSRLTNTLDTPDNKPYTYSIMNKLLVKPFRESPGYCGPASLHMVLGYFGIATTEQELAKLAKSLHRSGTSAEGLLTAAKKYGFQGKIKDKANFSDIQKWLDKKIPVIVDWFSENDGHYSVVISLTKHYIFIQDPEIAGIRKIDCETFKREWFDFPGDFITSPKDVIIRRLIAIYPA